jgi:hypothetical protein
MTGGDNAQEHEASDVRERIVGLDLEQHGAEQTAWTRGFTRGTPCRDCHNCVKTGRHFSAVGIRWLTKLVAGPAVETAACTSLLGKTGFQWLAGPLP